MLIAKYAESNTVSISALLKTHNNETEVVLSTIFCFYRSRYTQEKKLETESCLQHNNNNNNKVAKDSENKKSKHIKNKSHLKQQIKPLSSQTALKRKCVWLCNITATKSMQYRHVTGVEKYKQELF